MKITKQNDVARVKKHLPEFDFEKSLTLSQWRSVWKIVAEKEKQATIANRMAIIRAKNLIPGSRVVDEVGNRETIKNITIHGFLSFIGKTGSFSPKYWRRV